MFIFKAKVFCRELYGTDNTDITNTKLIFNRTC